MTLLCASIFVWNPEQAKRDLALAGEAGADIAELRIDAFKPTDTATLKQLREVIRSTGLRCIVTCRPVWEGGQSELPDEERLGLFYQDGVKGATYYDIEWRTFSQVKWGEKDWPPGSVITS